ncbi:MAG: FtsX-like permease family protein [Eubacteriales bacterium]|nr:FtsX-like permease family protein [Eubacteriales bacterium]
MLKTVLRRLNGNRWKAISLLIGLILAISIAYCIPVYSDAVLQRILIKTLEDAQQTTGKYPAVLSFDYRIAGVKKDAVFIESTIDSAFDALCDEMPMSVQTHGKMLKYEMFRRKIEEENRSENVVLTYLEDFENHVHVVSGRMFNPERSDGVVEVVASNRQMVKTLLTLNKIYEYSSMYPDETDLLRLEIVGIVEPNDPSDLYWLTPFDQITGGMFTAREAFDAKIAENMTYARHVTQFTRLEVFDFYDIRTDTAKTVTALFNRANEQLNATFPKNLLTFGMVPAVETYLADSATVEVSMYILTIPIFILLAFYIIMVSRLKLQSEQSEISVMQSRGAGRGYILGLYLIESLILMTAAVGIGPLLGGFLCKIVGASNGFLEFVNRKALDFRMVPGAWYAVGATALLFLLITMIPAFFGAGVNIVESKRGKRKKKVPFYHKYFLDVLFLAVSLYGYSTMEAQRKVFSAMLAEGTVGSRSTDVLTYLSSTLFALGAGMLFLRVYPLLVNLLFRLGRRIWPAWAYSAMNRVARNRDCSYIMLFLIVTMSVGIFNTDAARSINNHIENNVRTTTGADVNYMPVWRKYDNTGRLVYAEAENNGNLVKIYDEGVLVQSIKVTYAELLSKSICELDGVEAAARVYRETDIPVRGNGANMENVDVMYVDPYEFGTVAFSTYDMNPYHLNAYLNAMSRNEEALVVSNNLMSQLGLKPGDSLTVTNAAGSITGTVIAGVDAWPGFEKYHETERGRVYETAFVVGNLSKLFFEHEIRPYSFWVKRAPGMTDAALYQTFTDSEFGLKSMESATQAVIQEKNSPTLQGTNGLLSVSFLTAIVICALGFMIYWIISIKSRTLQFGISRALGLSKAGIMKMLICEQLLVSGVAAAMGILIGKIGSVLFVPMLAVNYTTVEDIIPFKVVATRGDLIRIGCIVGGMLIVCIAVLSILVIRQKIDRAVKLGEE